MISYRYGWLYTSKCSNVQCYIGGNTVIYVADFHSHDSTHRQDSKLDREAPVVIEGNVFIGAHSTILKGVTIGENSIVGACSIVSKNIPPNEVWAGNPDVFIKKCGPSSSGDAGTIDRRM